MKKLFTLDISFDEERGLLGVHIKGSAPKLAMIPLAVCRLILEIPETDKDQKMKEELIDVIKDKKLAAETMANLSALVCAGEMMRAVKEESACRRAN